MDYVATVLGGVAVGIAVAAFAQVNRLRQELEELRARIGPPGA